MIKKLSLTIAAFALAGPVSAGPVEQRAASEAPAFSEVDSDGSGTISKQEASAVPQLSNVFSAADSNRDGELAAAEYNVAVRSL